VRLATVASYNSACHHHRCILPFRYLSQDAPQHEWVTYQSDPSAAYDVLWLYGARAFTDWIEIANRKRKGMKLVWVVDDTLWNHPEWRHDQPSREHLASVNLACDVADLIVASTPALAEDVDRPHKTLVAPNLLEVGRYKRPSPPTDDDRIRILWSGSMTHKADLDVIDNALCRIMEKWQGKIEFHLLGAGPDKLLRDWWGGVGSGIEYTEWTHLSEYWYRIHQTQAHIELAPLHPCRFNQCKSAIRVQEAWAINAAVVASPVGEYRTVRDGVDGLVCGTEGEWFRAIDRLIADRTLREKLAQAGYQRVSEEWNWASKSSRAKWQPVVEKLDEWAGI
jgi:glycosyltransferase involved in cell wall biosynthesis